MDLMHQPVAHVISSIRSSSSSASQIVLVTSSMMMPRLKASSSSSSDSKSNSISVTWNCIINQQRQSNKQRRKEYQQVLTNRCGHQHTLRQHLQSRKVQCTRESWVHRRRNGQRRFCSYYYNTLDVPNFIHLKLTLTPTTFAVGLRAIAVSRASFGLVAYTSSLKTLPPTYSSTMYFIRKE